MRIIGLLALLSGAAFGQGWTALTGTRLGTACPSGASAVPGSCAAVVSAWSGAIADTLRNRLIIWGGGHNDYYGNEVYSLNLTANPVTLTRLNNPSPPTSTTDLSKAACVNGLADGAANSRHSYNGLAYISSADRMLVFGGGHACRLGGMYGDLWTLSLSGLESNPSQNNWTAQDPVNGAAGSQPQSLYLSQPPIAIYDPASDLTYIGQSSLGYWWSYEYSTNTYTLLTKSSPVPFSSTAVLYPPTNTIYFFGGDGSAGTQTGSSSTPRVYSMSIAHGTNWAATNITSSTTGCAGLAGAMNPGVSYDSAIDRIVGWPNFGNTVYIFDPATKTCTTQTFAGGPPDSKDYNGSQYTTGTYGRFQYFPDLDAFVVVNSAGSDAYMLRLSSGATPPPSPSLPVISSFTASPSVVSAGTSVTLSWATSGAASVSISPGVGAVASSGSTTVTPAASTSYILTATNSAGSTTATVAVTVSAPSAPAITSFSATPNSIASGQPATLSWAVTGATSIAISPGGFSSVTASGSTSVSPVATTTYTLTASNSIGSSTAQATLTVSTAAPPAPATVSNTLTITNAGATASNYPLQIGRPFAQGEIPNGQFPQAFLAGAGLPTQVDVKTRWPDGSLKHAVVSFLIPTFTAGQSHTITFGPGSTVGNTALTQAQMLAAGFNFDAQIQLTRTGVTKTASARTMLTNGDYTVWASGPIATTIILVNHAQGATCGGKAASKYDLGFDSYCAFRPAFEATFWPGINRVFVRYIGEVANTEQLENVVVDSMLLTAGRSSVTIYSRATALTMNAATRWTKTAWIGGAPPTGAINHNLAYLAYAKALPNYDTSKTIAESTLASAYSTWTASAKDLYQKGVWDTTLSSGGGHPHVGPYPAWAVRWFYTGDYRAQEIAMGQADLAASMEFHYREGKAGKKLDRAGAIDGVGYPVSINGRPTAHWVSGIAYSGTATNDRIVAVGTVTGTGWGYDGPTHSFESFAHVYLLTGDYFYLEEAMFMAGMGAAFAGGNDTNTWRSRGPTGAEGGIPDKASQIQQTRGQAWNFRSRVEAAALVADGNPFKDYLELLIADAIAYWEGQRDITTGAYHGTTMWNWGRNTALPASGPRLWDSWECSAGTCGILGVPPLHFWDTGNAALCDYTGDVTNNSVAKDCGTPWMQNYVVYALGRGKELGYATNALLEWASLQITGPITDPGYNPYLVGSYRVATISNLTGQHFATWADVKASFTSPAQTETGFEPGAAGTSGGADGNVQTLVAATSMVADQPNGATAWAWIQSKILPSISGDLKWAIIPRISAPLSSNRCDLNGDGKVDSVDVQLAIDQTLGTAPCTTANLDGSGQCTVVSVQRIVNASLGQACRTGI